MAMTEAVVRPPRNPPAEAWLAVKPIFLDLYLRQDKTLDEVRHHLQTHHSFTASTKAYKLRVKQWSAFKYRKRPKPRNNAVAGHSLPAAAKARTRQTKSDSQPVSWEGQILSFGDDTSTRGFKAKDFTNSMIRMHPQIHDTSGYLYAATRDFWQWTIGSSSSPRMDHVWSSHLAPGWALIDVVTLLYMPSRHQEGQARLLQVQESISTSIKDTPAATLLAVIGLFTFDKWHSYPGVQTVLFNYIKEYTLRHLPLDHPLRTVVMYLKNENMRHVAGQLLVVQVDTLMQIQREGGRFPDWFYFAPTLGLIQARLLNDAHRVSMNRLQQTDSKLKRCRILELIVRCQFYARDYDGCIKNGLWVLKMINELLAEGNYMWGDMVTIYDMLARSYTGKSNFAKTIEYNWLAFKTAYQQYGQYSTNVQYYCFELESSLTKHDRPDELALLRSQYSFMFSNEPGPNVSSDGDKPRTSRARLQAGSLDMAEVLKALIDI